ncbi:MAG TPA: TfoX/Sxy family protein [Solirubrobacterales bacterium]|nr:TfoX/Sxy family protein [Solirubrobacterales bacterium]
MAYDERLADELRERLQGADGELSEKKMFGGLAFMVDGNLTVVASRHGGLMARTDPADAEETLAQPGAEAVIMRGRQMPGWIYVDPEALADEAVVDAWVTRALAFVAGLPPK